MQSPPKRLLTGAIDASPDRDCHAKTRNDRHVHGRNCAVRHGFAVATQAEPFARYILSDPYRSHRADRSGARRGRKPADQAHRGGRRRRPQRAPRAFCVALRTVRRNHRVPVGHRHGRCGSGRTRETRRTVPATGGQPTATAAFRPFVRTHRPTRPVVRRRCGGQRFQRGATQVSAPLGRGPHQTRSRGPGRHSGRQGVWWARRRNPDSCRSAEAVATRYQHRANSESDTC